MSTATEQASDTEFCLPADLGVAQAAELRTELLKFLENEADISIKGSEVQRIHTAGLQILTAWIQDRKQNGRGCNWTELSPELRQAAENLGLLELMCIPTDTQANAEELKE